MDALVFYNQLRKAGVNLYTCSEGPIDLDKFTNQLLLFVGQKGSNDYLSELAAKVVRKDCQRQARPLEQRPRALRHGVGEYDASGRFIQRLPPRQRARRGNHLRLLPSTDQRKVEAVRYAFERFDTAYLSMGQLARELQEKGYPSPARTLKGWTHWHVYRILTRCAYAGIIRWGLTSEGKYFHAQGEDVVPATERRRQAPAKAH